MEQKGNLQISKWVQSKWNLILLKNNKILSWWNIRLLLLLQACFCRMKQWISSLKLYFSIHLQRYPSIVSFTIHTKYILYYNKGIGCSRHLNFSASKYFESTVLFLSRQYSLINHGMQYCTIHLTNSNTFLSNRSDNSSCNQVAHSESHSKV